MVLDVVVDPQAFDNSHNHRIIIVTRTTTTKITMATGTEEEVVAVGATSSGSAVDRWNEFGAECLR